MESHIDRIRGTMAEGKAICLGIDPAYEKLPAQYTRNAKPWEAIKNFSIDTIHMSNEVVAAYKPNYAFFMRYGKNGIGALEAVIRELKSVCPHIPIILEMLVGDTEDTNVLYADCFNAYQMDAITVGPYMGTSTFEPFLAYDNGTKGAYALVKSSNRGSDEFQNVPLNAKTRFYQHVAEKIVDMNKKHGNLGVMAAATFPYDLRSIRDITGPMALPYLINGLTTQGGKIDEVVEAGADSAGGGLLLSMSRSILYAMGPGSTPIEKSKNALLQADEESREAFEKIKKPRA